MASKKTKKAMNPLPSLLYASSHDAASMRMLDAGRKVWNRDDYDHAADTMTRLIRASYTMPSDADERMSSVRYGIAYEMERRGMIGLYSEWAAVMQAIEDTLKTASDAAG